MDTPKQAALNALDDSTFSAQDREAIAQAMAAALRVMLHDEQVETVLTDFVDDYASNILRQVEKSARAVVDLALRVDEKLGG